MKGLFLILISVALFSCQTRPNSNTNESEKSFLKSDSLQYDTPFDKTIERFFPSKDTSEQFDTTIGNISISIIKSTISSYVIVDFTQERIRHIDKYRDFEIRLVINQNTVELIDTTFRKESFLNPTDSFLNIATFHNYWFNAINNEEIELYGAISKPETDWSYFFHHIYNLKTKKFKIIEDNEEENE